MGRLRQTTAEIQAILDKVEQGGAGLQYATERTVFPNRMIYYGEDVDEPIELPEEQKAYNIETADMYHNGNDVFISFASFFFHPVVVAEDGSDGSWKRVGIFNSYHMKER